MGEYSTRDSVPTLTDDERREALEKALEARRKRTAFKARLERGELSAEEAVKLAKEDGVLKRIKVMDFVQCWPGYGKTRAVKLLERLKISDTRRIAGLGPNQAARLVEALDL